MAAKSRNRRRKPPAGSLQEGLRAKGLFRVQIEEDGEIVGDSGWHENLITNDGFNKYLVCTVGGISASSLSVNCMALGTGGVPNATDTQLPGEITSSTKRQTVSGATSNTSKTVHFVGTFASSNSFLGGSSNISNIGLYNSTAAGTLFAGNTFASSTCATNQNVNCTYDVTFS